MLIAAFKRLLPVLILVAAATTGAWLFINREQPEETVSVIEPLLIDIARVEKTNITINVQAQGTVTPRTETSLVSRVAGEVMEVSPQFAAGGFFRKGELLVRIDDGSYRASVKEAEAQLASAEAMLAMEKGRAEVARQDWVKAGSRDASPAARDLALRKPQLAEAQARLDSANAALIRARDDLRHTRIEAPYTGLIKAKHTDVGQYLTTGARIADTYAVDSAEVRLPIPSDKLTYLDLPSAQAPDSDDLPPVALTATLGDSEYKWQARLVRSEAALDPRSRVLYVVARVDDPYGLDTEREQPLRIGTFVDAEIRGKRFSNLVAIPRYLLRSGNQLWVIKDQRLKNRRVETLRTAGEVAYVSQGLEQGEHISLSSLPFALPGTPVTENRGTNTEDLAASLKSGKRNASLSELLFSALAEAEKSKARP